MSDTPLRDAVQKLDTLPSNEAHAGLVAQQNGDVGAFIEGQKDIGKPGGWTLAGTAQWMRKTGASIVVGLGWRR